MNDFIMEIFSPASFDFSFSQNGRGIDIDRYIYSNTQTGEGLGTVFGSLASSIIPVASEVIKALTYKSPSRGKRKQLAAGIKSNRVRKVHKSHSKKWQSL